MPPDFLRLMERATALTRQGNLHSATAEIQAALAGTAPDSAAQANAIDVESRWVPDARDPAAGAGEVHAEQFTHAEQFIAGRFGAGHAGRDY